MRCTQPMGLAPLAEAFLAQNAILKNVCVHCDRSDGYACEVIGKVGMFDDLDLHTYLLKGGRVATEYIQMEIWSSGPMIWLALDVEGEKYEWDTSEFKEHE